MGTPRFNRKSLIELRLIVMEQFNRQSSIVNRQSVKSTIERRDFLWAIALGAWRTAGFAMPGSEQAQSSSPPLSKQTFTFKQSVVMTEQLSRAGVEHELITIQDGGHGFDRKLDDPPVAQAFDRVLAFLQRHLS